MRIDVNVDLLDESNIKVTFTYREFVVKLIKRLPARDFVKKGSYWKIPLADTSLLVKEFDPYRESGQVGLKISDEVKTAWLEFKKKTKTNRDLALLDESDFEPKGLKPEVQLYPFQKVGANFLYNTKHALMAFDMGLGKSITSISVSSEIIQEKGKQKILIICPASLKYNWAVELAKFTDYSYTVISGDAKQRTKLYHNFSDFTIMNYDLLRIDYDKMKDIKWDIIIADEIQRAKNYTTATSKTIRKLSAEYIFALTGTPIENDLLDMFTIMRFIDPSVLGTNAKSFKERYCTCDYFGKVQSYKNLDEINKKLSHVMIRRKKRDVLDELPEKTVNFYYISLQKEERSRYNEYKKGLITDWKSGKLKHVDALSRIIYMREICDSLNLVDPHDKIISSKLDELKKIVSELPPETKVVIFTAFERMAKIIEDNIGFTSVHLHGGVANNCILEREIEKDIKKKNKNLKGSELEIEIHEAKKKAVCVECPYFDDDDKCYARKKLSAKFNHDENVKLFISTDAGKEGLNLQAGSVIINYDMSFNPAVNEQRIARIDRIGQKSDKIMVINMVCLDTIEERILSVLERKQEIFDLVVDHMDEEVVRKLDTEKLMGLI